MLATLTPEQAEVVLANYQGRRCAICTTTLNPGRSTHVDHDHFTGMIRGLLCSRCNVAEGRSDAPEFVAYRDDHPAKRLGIVAVYCSQFGPARLDRSMVYGDDLAGCLAVPRMDFEVHAEVIKNWIVTGKPTALKRFDDRSYGIDREAMRAAWLDEVAS